MDDGVFSAGERRTSRPPSRQGSLRLRALAPPSIGVEAPAAATDAAISWNAEIIPLLTPLHVIPASEAGGQQQAATSSWQHDEEEGGHTHTQAVSPPQRACSTSSSERTGGWCTAKGVTRWAWRHPATPFGYDQPAPSVGFVFQDCA